ncbi:MAG: PAAR-like protein [Caldilineaceae bacterium]
MNPNDPKELIVFSDAQLRCSFGTGMGKLVAPNDGRTEIKEPGTGRIVRPGTIDDYVPDENILFTGSTCLLIGNPDVEKATRQSIFGYFRPFVRNPETQKPPPLHQLPVTKVVPQPCKPVVKQPWYHGASNLLVRREFLGANNQREVVERPALHNACVNYCHWGGKITITDPAQPTNFPLKVNVEEDPIERDRAAKICSVCGHELASPQAKHEIQKCTDALHLLTPI